MFISVKEAADLSGKSSTTIYRLCNKRIKTLYVRKEGNKFLIDRDFLLATYPPEIPDNTKNVKVESFEPQIKQGINSNSEKENSIEYVESSVVLQETTEKVNKSEITPFVEPVKEKIGTTPEPANKKPKTFFQDIASWEALIGISASMLTIAIFIYLLSVYAD